MEYNCHLELDDLQQCLKNTFGAGYFVNDVKNMHGGAQKVVYKVECTNRFICMLYVWDLSMNYFQQEIEKQHESERSYGSELFELNNAYLCQQGINTPALYYLNKEKNRYAFDYALVEYIEGQDISNFMYADSAAQDHVFGSLGAMLSRMHGMENPSYGKLNNVRNGTDKCHMQNLDNAKVQLEYAANHIAEIGSQQGRLLDKLNELESNIKPRARYGYIHGELGPDHVFVNKKLEPYLIDIEGAMFYDIEYEHSFLVLRFGEHYRFLKNENLDRSRMLFYKLYHHISCTAGGLKLLHRGHPNKKLAKEIADYNYRSALKFIEKSIDSL